MTKTYKVEPRRSADKLWRNWGPWPILMLVAAIAVSVRTIGGENTLLGITALMILIAVST